MQGRRQFLMVTIASLLFWPALFAVLAWMMGVV